MWIIPYIILVVSTDSMCLLKCMHLERKSSPVFTTSLIAHEGWICAEKERCESGDQSDTKKNSLLLQHTSKLQREQWSGCTSPGFPCFLKWNPEQHESHQRQHPRRCTQATARSGHVRSVCVPFSTLEVKSTWQLKTSSCGVDFKEKETHAINESFECFHTAWQKTNFRRSVWKLNNYRKSDRKGSEKVWGLSLGVLWQEGREETKCWIATVFLD